MTGQTPVCAVWVSCYITSPRLRPWQAYIRPVCGACRSWVLAQQIPSNYWPAESEKYQLSGSFPYLWPLQCEMFSFTASSSKLGLVKYPYCCSVLKAFNNKILLQKNDRHSLQLRQQTFSRKIASGKRGTWFLLGSINLTWQFWGQLLHNPFGFPPMFPTTFTLFTRREGLQKNHRPLRRAERKDLPKLPCLCANRRTLLTLRVRTCWAWQAPCYCGTGERFQLECWVWTLEASTWVCVRRLQDDRQ